MSTAVWDGPALPWAETERQEQRFERIRSASLAAVLMLCALVSWLPLPQRLLPAEPIAPLPIQLDLKPRRELPPLPPPPAPTPSLAPAVEAPPVAKPTEPKPAPPVERPVQRPSVSVERSGSPAPGPTAKERAASAGIGDLAEGLAGLRDSSVASKAITGRPDMTGTPRPNATAEYGAGPDPGPGSERSLITARAGAGTGGVNNAALSRGHGSGGLAGRGTTQVPGYGGGGNGTGPGTGRGTGGGGGGGNGAGGGGGGGNGNGGSLGARSREEIEMVFDQNKGVIYALYNRALRVDPSLQGKLVLELTIQPNGKVTACRVISSEFDAPEFQQQLVQRVLLFRFEDRDVAPVTTTKPIDFFPR